MTPEQLQAIRERYENAKRGYLESSVIESHEDVPALLDEVERLQPFEVELGKALKDVVFWQEASNTMRLQGNDFYRKLQESRKEIERLHRALNHYAKGEFANEYSRMDYARHILSGGASE